MDTDVKPDRTICVNLFSQSEENGLGPNLNIGNTLGYCNDDDDDDDDDFVDHTNYKSIPNSKFGSYLKSINAIWPNPSHGTINIQSNFRKSEIVMLFPLMEMGLMIFGMLRK